MIERLLILLAVLGLALAWVALRERRTPSGVVVRPGITVFTGPDCRMCPGLLASLQRAGASYHLVDVSTVHAPGVSSLPTVVVADAGGEVVMRRSGRAAVTDLSTILAVAAAGGAIRESA